VEASQGRLRKLDEYMRAPCVAESVEETQALFKKVLQEWDEVTKEQGEALNSVIKEAETKYGTYLHNRGSSQPSDITVRKRFRNEKIYSEWFTPSAQAWDWLLNSSAAFFKVVKRFEAQTWLNGVAVKNAKDTYDYLAELSGELHHALAAAKANPTRDNIQACVDLSASPGIIHNVWKETDDEVEKFVRERKPEAYAEDRGLIALWEVPATSVCAPYQKDWREKATTKYNLYDASFKAVKAAFEPIHLCAFMHKYMPLFDGWSANDIETKYKAFMEDLQRK